MSPKIETLGQKFAHFGRFEGSFLAIFVVKKSRFLDFFKVVLEVFKHCFLP